MFSLNLPDYNTKISTKDNKPVIFDDLRRCYVALTPEEWVRQHFVHYLIEQHNYPASLMANEFSGYSIYVEREIFVNIFEVKTASVQTSMSLTSKTLM